MVPLEFTKPSASPEKFANIKLVQLADAKNTNPQKDQKAEKSGDDVQDVDFEEVKD